MCLPVGDYLSSPDDRLCLPVGDYLSSPDFNPSVVTLTVFIWLASITDCVGLFVLQLCCFVCVAIVLVCLCCRCVDLFVLPLCWSVCCCCVGLFMLPLCWSVCVAVVLVCLCRHCVGLFVLPLCWSVCCCCVGLFVLPLCWSVCVAVVLVCLCRHCVGLFVLLLCSSVCVAIVLVCLCCSQLSSVDLHPLAAGLSRWCLFCALQVLQEEVHGTPAQTPGWPLSAGQPSRGGHPSLPDSSRSAENCQRLSVDGGWEIILCVCVCVDGGWNISLWMVCVCGGGGGGGGGGDGPVGGGWGGIRAKLSSCHQIAEVIFFIWSPWTCCNLLGGGGLCLIVHGREGYCV